MTRDEDDDKRMKSKHCTRIVKHSMVAHGSAPVFEPNNSALGRNWRSDRTYRKCPNKLLRPTLIGAKIKNQN
jgi:hypothetical protein